MNYLFIRMYFFNLIDQLRVTTLQNIKNIMNILHFIEITLKLFFFSFKFTKHITFSLAPLDNLKKN